MDLQNRQVKPKIKKTIMDCLYSFKTGTDVDKIIADYDTDFSPLKWFG